MPDELRPTRSFSSPLRRIRGYLAFTVVGLVLLVCDLLQRTVVAGAARLFPRARHRILTSWIQFLRFVSLDFGTALLGGARVPPRRFVIPCRPDVLVVMNHQSLLDIPLVVRAIEDGYPRIVTRRRYARGIPVIPHMTRLYQYPLVDPQATVKGHVRGLREAARSGETPVAIFPEGTRTRTGALGAWKRSGLRKLLGARRWEVHMVVADGLWQSRSVREFLSGVPGMEVELTHRGPFESPEPDGDLEAFMDELEERMKDTLEELRRGSAARA
jgi:1-acyl-sn-glycerol-3-phosphate acyltransferase